MVNKKMRVRLLVAAVPFAVVGLGAVALAASAPQATSIGAKLDWAAQRIQEALNLQATHPRTAQPPVPPAPMPTSVAPRETGIVPTNSGPFSPLDFKVSNSYVQSLGSQWLTVYAGASRASDGSLVSGGIRVYVDPIDPSSAAPTTYVGQFLSSLGPTELTIVSAADPILTLRDGQNHTVTFNLSTHQFG